MFEVIWVWFGGRTFTLCFACCWVKVFNHILVTFSLRLYYVPYLELIRIWHGARGVYPENRERLLLPLLAPNWFCSPFDTCLSSIKWSLFSRLGLSNGDAKQGRLSHYRGHYEGLQQKAILIWNWLRIYFRTLRLFWVVVLSKLYVTGERCFSCPFHLCAATILLATGC